jgi:hypothetical protein
MWSSTWLWPSSPTFTRGRKNNFYKFFFFTFFIFYLKIKNCEKML